jgi:hypothetical protein
VVQRIFHEVVELGCSEYRIAEGLNSDGVLSPSGKSWGAGSVIARLRNEKYVGTMVYNQTSQKLKTPCHRKSMRVGNAGKEATEFHRENREAIDEGSTVAWPERFNHDELSAIQHAMNLKLQDEAAFFAASGS